MRAAQGSIDLDGVKFEIHVWGTCRETGDATSSNPRTSPVQGPQPPGARHSWPPLMPATWARNTADVQGVAGMSSCVGGKTQPGGSRPPADGCALENSLENSEVYVTIPGSLRWIRGVDGARMKRP